MNCVFYGNEADYGGGVANNDDCSSWFINCTFAENDADTYGSSMYNDIELDGWVRVINSIMYNNTSPGSVQQIYNDNSSITTVAYSDIQDSGGSGTANWDPDFGVDTGGNVDCDPEFFMSNVANYSVYGNDELPCTYDDGLVPVALCDVIDSADGYNTSDLDITSTARKDMDKADDGIGSCSYADIGAYEFIAPMIMETTSVVIMCFIDEASDYFGDEELYNNDLQIFYSLTGYPGFDVKIGCYVPPTNEGGFNQDQYDVVYGNSEPDGITLEQFDYPRGSMPVEAFTNSTLPLGIYQKLWTDTSNNPDYVILLVDGTDSLGVDDLQTGYGLFKTWLQQEKSINPDTEETCPDEHWLDWVNDELIEIFINGN